MSASELFSKNKLIMAPIAGFTNAGFRAAALECGAGIAYTEMISAKGLLFNNEGTKSLLYTTEAEKYPAVQLFGSDPRVMKAAAESGLLNKFRLIDINMGCPVPKIVKNGEGSALLLNPGLASEIVSAVKEGAKDKIISAKIRIGFSADKINAQEMARALERGGADFITVHGRTREQMYSGKVNLKAIREAKESVGIPVVGNGDVTDLDSYSKMLETGADAVMIGRGALKNPNLFAELSGKPPVKSKREMIKEILEIMLGYLPAHVVTNNMKKQIALFSAGTRGNREIKEKVFAAASAEELLNICNAFF